MLYTSHTHNTYKHTHQYLKLLFLQCLSKYSEQNFIEIQVANKLCNSWQAKQEYEKLMLCLPLT